MSFFITARFAGQDNRDAFCDVVLEQLAELLGRPMPAFLTDATRDAHLLDMLGEAAESCRQRGERLILVIDGLDEDRGVTSGPDAYSIAALLPVRPPAGMRVIVAGRPNPRFLRTFRTIIPCATRGLCARCPGPCTRPWFGPTWNAN